MITLYSMPSSGNSYKIRLLLAQLGIPFKHVATEWDNGRELTVQAEFLALNPAGKVPLVQFENGKCLAESNAILTYFGEGTSLIPSARLERATMFQWMFFEQNAHESSIAVRKSFFTYEHRKRNATPDKLQTLLEAGNRALDVMEVRLRESDFLSGSSYSLADIALYAYTHSADQGGFDITSRSGIAAWLERVKNQPGHVPIEWLP